MANMNTLLEGYLKKQSRFPIKYWFERFFLLQTNGDLIYYKSHHKVDKVIGRIKLKDIDNVGISPQKHNGCQLEIVSVKKGRVRKHLLLANNKAEARIWLTFVEEVRQKISSTDLSEWKQGDFFKNFKRGKNSKQPKYNCKIWEKSHNLAEKASDITSGQYEEELLECQCYSPLGFSTYVLPVRGKDLVKEVRDRLYTMFLSTGDGKSNTMFSSYSLRLGIENYFYIDDIDVENKRMCDYIIFQTCFEQGKMLVVQLVYVREFEPPPDASKVLIKLENIKAIQAQRMYLHVQVRECILKIQPGNSKEDELGYCHVVASLYHGGERLGQPYECSTSFIPHNKSLRWNELLTFSILQADLPQVLSLNFAVYHSFKTNREDICLAKLLGWTNMHVVRRPEKDIKDLNKESTYCLQLWACEPIYSCGTILEGTTQESCGVLSVKVDHQNLHTQNSEVPNKPQEDHLDEQANTDIPILPSVTDVQNLNIIIDNADITAQLDDSQKRLIWQFRDYATQFPNAMTKFLRAVQWDNHNSVLEVHRLLNLWRPMTSFQALELLGPQFGDMAVRAYATSRLELLSNEEFSMVLIQLVQCLQYEPSQEESPLLELLIQRASSHWPIGHQFFWHVKSGMQMPLFFKRFGLILDRFLESCSPHFLKSFLEQEELVTKLLVIAKAIKVDASQEQRQSILQTSLLDIKFPKPILLPIHPKLKVKSIKVSKCKFMKSKKLPLWLVFQRPSDDPITYVPTIFKSGDDLRQDMLTLQMLGIMEKIWWKNGLDLKMTIYTVIATGVDDGMMEVVEDAETLSNISKKAGGGLECFKEDTLANWLLEHNKTREQYDMAVDNFIRSCAGYSVATCVLGIGDRHNDNVMIKRNGELFHIDFGHILGNFKSKFGVKRERAPFVFTPDFAFVMGGIYDKRFRNFEYTCVKAFNRLRQNAGLFLNLINLMVSAGLPELRVPSHISYMRDRLLLNRPDAMAGEYFKKWIHESLHTKTTQINNAIHTWKQQ